MTQQCVFLVMHCGERLPIKLQGIDLLHTIRAIKSRDTVLRLTSCL